LGAAPSALVDQADSAEPEAGETLNVVSRNFITGVYVHVVIRGIAAT